MAKSTANGDEPSDELVGTWYVQELLQENQRLKKLVNELEQEIIALVQFPHPMEDK